VIRDTRENVLTEAKAFLVEAAQRSLQESMRQTARGSKMIQFKGQPIPQRTYKFITNHNI
jgi:hypothetical protein